MAKKTNSLVFLVVFCAIIILTTGCKKRDEPANQVATETAAEALRQKEVAKAQAVAERKKAELEAAQKARLVAETEAEKARLIAEQKAFEEAERAKTHPVRLAAAEAEVAEAMPIYTDLLEKVKELKQCIAVSQRNLRHSEESIKILESKESAAKTEMSTITSTVKNGRLSQQEKTTFLQRQAGLTRELRSITIKIGKEKNEIDRERMRIGIREGELMQTESQLNEAQNILSIAQGNLDKIKNETINIARQDKLETQNRMTAEKQ